MIYFLYYVYIDIIYIYTYFLHIRKGHFRRSNSLIMLHKGSLQDHHDPQFESKHPTYSCPYIDIKGVLLISHVPFGNQCYGHSRVFVDLYLDTYISILYVYIIAALEYWKIHSLQPQLFNLVAFNRGQFVAILLCVDR